MTLFANDENTIIRDFEGKTTTNTFKDATSLELIHINGGITNNSIHKVVRYFDISYDIVYLII